MADAVLTFISAKSILPGEKHQIPQIIVAISLAILFTHSQYGRKKHFKSQLNGMGFL